jgi:hypothetical protein
MPHVPDLTALTREDAATIESLAGYAQIQLIHEIEAAKCRLKQSAPDSAYEADNKAEIAAVEKMLANARAFEAAARGRRMARPSERRAA